MANNYTYFGVTFSSNGNFTLESKRKTLKGKTRLISVFRTWRRIEFFDYELTLIIGFLTVYFFQHWHVVWNSGVSMINLTVGKKMWLKKTHIYFCTWCV